MRSAYKISRVPLIGISVCCILGMVLSIYAYHVETTAHADPTYKALCDISEVMSCSKVFSSRYGKGFGIIDRFLDKDHVLNQPNSVFGMLFYLINALLAFNTSPQMALLQLIVSILGSLGCVYLAVVLVFILEDFCVVCVSTYVVNALILIAAGFKYRALKAAQSKREGRLSNENRKSNGNKKNR